MAGVSIIMEKNLVPTRPCTSDSWREGTSGDARAHITRGSDRRERRFRRAANRQLLGLPLFAVFVSNAAL
jgi:hypothetical protein